MGDKKQILVRRIDQAMGREAADLVIKNARYLNVIDGNMVVGDIGRNRGYHRRGSGNLSRHG